MTKREAARIVVKASRLAGLGMAIAALLASIRHRLGWGINRHSEEPKPLAQLPLSADYQSKLLPDYQTHGDESDASIFAFTA